MTRKLLVILSPYEHQALIKLAARLDVSELYALRIALIEHLYNCGLLDEKIRNALLCRLLKGRAGNSKEVKVRNELERLKERGRFVEKSWIKEIPQDLRSSARHMELMFEVVIELLLDGKLDREEIDYWLEKAKYFDFLDNAQRFLKMVEELRLKSEAPPNIQSGHEVQGRDHAGRVQEIICRGCEGIADGSHDGAKQSLHDSSKPIDQPLKIVIRPIFEEKKDKAKEDLWRELISLIQNASIDGYSIMKIGGRPMARIPLIGKQRRFKELEGYRGCEVIEERGRAILLIPFHEVVESVEVEK